MSINKKLRLAVNLEGENAEKFLEIQKLLGVKSATEVVRILVNWYYRKHVEA